MNKKVYFVIPQFLVTEELVTLASEMIDSVRASCPDAFIISVDDCGEYQKAIGAEEALLKSDLVLKNEKNSGFAITCNNGFRWIFENSGVDNCYIICANNDIIINRKTVPELIFPFENFDNVAISGIVSTKEKLWEGQPLEEMNWGEISEGGLIRDRMSDGGLWCSTKEILLNMAEYERKF
jgi:GT2 family glycosyltransferase